MNLPEKAIDEYKEIYFKEFGVELSDKEASDQAHNLITLMRLATGEPSVLP